MALSKELMSELDTLLEPASGNSPAGLELDGTLELNALELASAEPETSVVKGVELEDERNWRDIRVMARGLLERQRCSAKAAAPFTTRRIRSCFVI